MESGCITVWVTEDTARWACVVTYLCVYLRIKNVHSSERDQDPICDSLDPQVLILNGISIGSSYFVWLTVAVNKQEWQTDRETDHATSSVTMHVTRQINVITLQQLATTFCQGANSKSKLSVYCRYLSGRLWWGDVFRLESSSLRPRCSYIQTGISS